MNSKQCHKTKHRTNEEKEYLNKRLSLIEGQIRGIKQMIDDDRYCSDVLIQISAVNNSLKSISGKILESHMKTCMVEEIRKDNPEIVCEIMDLIKKIK